MVRRGELMVVVVAVASIAAVGDGVRCSVWRGSGLVVVMVVAVLQVVLGMIEMRMSAEEVSAGGRRDVVVLTVLFARRELGVDDEWRGPAVVLLVRRRKRARDGVHQKRAHDH